MDLYWPPIDDDDALGRQQHEGQRAGGLDLALSERETSANVQGTAHNSSAGNILRELLPELLDRILAFLDPVDLRPLRLCCKWLRNVSYRQITRLRVTDPAEDDLAELYRRLALLTHLTHLTISASSLRVLSPMFIGYSLPARIFPILRDLFITLEHSAQPQPYLLSALRKATALTHLCLNAPDGSNGCAALLLSCCPGLHALSLHGYPGVAAHICALTALRRLEMDHSTGEAFWRLVGERAVQLPPLLSEINLSFPDRSGNMSQEAADGIAQALAQLPRLEKLRVAASQFDSALIPVLQQGRLVELHVGCTGESPEPWFCPTLPMLTRLQTLKVKCYRRVRWKELCAEISCASSLTRLELKGSMSSWVHCLRPEHLVPVMLPRLVVLAVGPLATRPANPPRVDIWRLLAHGMPALRDLSLTFFNAVDYGKVVGCGSGLTRLTSLAVQAEGICSVCPTEMAARLPGGRGWGPGPQGRGYGPQGRGYGQQGRGYGPQGRGYGPQGRGYGPQGRGYGPQGRGPGPQGRGYGPQGRGFGLHGRGRGQRELPFVAWPPADFAISNTGLQSAYLELGVAYVERDVRLLAELARKCRLHARISLGRFGLTSARMEGPALEPWQNLLEQIGQRDLALEELPGFLRRLGVPKGARWTIWLMPRTAETEREFEVARQLQRRADVGEAAYELSNMWIPVSVDIPEHAA